MNSFDAADRGVFEEQSVPLYEQMLVQHGLPGADPRIADGGEWTAGLALLQKLGLVQHDPDTDVWMAEDPSAAQAQVVTPLSQAGSRLLTESSEWARIFAGVGQAWRRSPQPTSAGPFTQLRGAAIEPYLTGLVAECEEEVLTAQPEFGRNPRRGLARALQRDLELVERGCRLRTLYQHSARRNSATHKYVAEIGKHGSAEVRTLDEFFNRLIVVDRRVAVIPNADDLSVAVVVREPAVVAYLVDVFERTWERARPFTNRGMSLVRDIAVEQRAMTMRMLIEGHSDQVSAKRLGVSARTYAAYVSDLKAEYDVATRFQLGYLMGQHGISGTELPDEEETEG